MNVAVVGGPASWRGAEIADATDWRLEFSGPDLEAIVHLARDVAGSVRSGERTMAELGRRHADLATLVDMAQQIRGRLLEGRGFALLRGLPVDHLDDLENQVLYWLIGVHVGIPLHQNDARDVLIRVVDQGKDFNTFGVRAYETTADLDYHTDSSDVVALYCLRPAMRGGTSTIVSSVAIHDEMVRRRPDLAALLHEPWPQISPVDGAVTYSPVCALNQRGDLFTRYGRKYTELAPVQGDGVAPLTADQIDALDLFDEITRSDGMALNMDFRPGDVQFLSNHLVMHARTEYVDWPEADRKRELLRMWLVFRDGFDVPDAFRHVGFVARSVAADVA